MSVIAARVPFPSLANPVSWTIILVVYGSVALFCWYNYAVYPMPFNSADWKKFASNKSEQRHSEVRQRMAADLIRGKKLIGLSKAQVVELLGPGRDTPNDQLSYDLTPFLRADEMNVHFTNDRVDDCRELSYAEYVD